MTRSNLIAGGAGLIFAFGLGVAGMTDPVKVLAFLDIAGEWDASMAFVMLGAIGVHMIPARRAFTGRIPWVNLRTLLPSATAVDWRLLVGAALFGVGWGLAGYCPGPALVAIPSLNPDTLTFVAAMIAGMLVHARVAHLLVARELGANSPALRDARAPVISTQSSVSTKKWHEAHGE